MRPGGVGMSIARFLEGGVKLGRNAEPKAPVFHEGSGLVINTIPPGDFSYYEMLNDLGSGRTRDRCSIPN